MSVEEAMAVLKTALREDEGYWIGWQANIAMAIHDTPMGDEERPFMVEDHEVHQWRNRCARTFLNRLCGLQGDGTPMPDDIPGMAGIALSVASEEA